MHRLCKCCVSDTEDGNVGSISRTTRLAGIAKSNDNIDSNVRTTVILGMGVSLAKQVPIRAGAGFCTSGSTGLEGFLFYEV